MTLPLFAVLCVVAYCLWSWRTIRRIKAENPPLGHFVAVDGGRLHVVRRDPPGRVRADVVLLHGASGNHADMMEALGIPLSAQGFRVFAIDRPGHGHSDRWPDASSLGRQVERVRTALETLGVRKAIVVGHSLGGAVAQNFAIDHGDFAQGVVMISPVTQKWPGGVRWYYNAAALPVAGFVFAAIVVLPAGLATMRSAVAGVFRPMVTPPDYVRRTGAKLVLRPGEFVANARDVTGLKAFVAAQAPRENTVRVPVAIVAGDDNDTIVSTTLHALASADAIPGATLKIVPGVGHSPHWTARQTVLDAVEDVYARSAASPDNVRRPASSEYQTATSALIAAAGA